MAKSDTNEPSSRHLPTPMSMELEFCCEEDVCSCLFYVASLDGRRGLEGTASHGKINFAVKQQCMICCLFLVPEALFVWQANRSRFHCSAVTVPTERPLPIGVIACVRVPRAT